MLHILVPCTFNYCNNTTEIALLCYVYKIINLEQETNAATPRFRTAAFTQRNLANNI